MHFNGKKILIVEDDQVLSLMLCSMIERMNCKIIGPVAKGKDAIELAKNTNPDLILMDIMLADEIDGISAMEKISAFSKVPVIYITGNSDSANKERAIQIGYHAYLIKPVLYDELLRNIHSLFSE